MNPKHLLVDISAHGFGHVAQTAAVLNALDMQQIRLTIRSKAPEALLRARIQHPFKLIPYQQDNGMVMHDALRVDVLETMRWYKAFHADYDERKREAALALEKLKVDMVFANIPYLSLAGARLAGVPAIALCSLNWADIFKHYCAQIPRGAVYYQEMLAAYNSAQYFLQPEPSMPMPELNNAKAIAPIAQAGIAQREQLLESLALPDTAKLILIALGGIGMQYPLDTWPAIPNVYWIFPDEIIEAHPRRDFILQSEAELSYMDLMASCDVVMTKTGYGTQTEAVMNHIPALCVQRADWPETPFLDAWHSAQGEVEFTTWQQIQSGDFVALIQSLLERVWTKPSIQANGAIQAAELIQQMLSQTTSCYTARF